MQITTQPSYGNEWLGKTGQVIESGAPRTSTNSFKARMTRAAGKLVSISMYSASRVNSSMTLKMRKRRPYHGASAMKSQLLPWFVGDQPASMGSLMRSGKRFLPRLGKFSLRSP